MSSFGHVTADKVQTPLYGVGLDLGTNSIGFAVVGYDPETMLPTRILKTGSRVFDNGTEPKSGKSLAVKRRSARSARRNKDRAERRQQKLVNAMKRIGLVPLDEKAFKQLEMLNPYKLRADGLERQLPLHHLGRAFFQLAQRRGYRSNAQMDAVEKDSKATKKGITELYRQLDVTSSRSVGEFFYKECLLKNRPVRLRSSKAENNHSLVFELFVERQMIEEEFSILWEAQKRFYTGTKRAYVFSDENYDELFETIFHQRPLKPQETGYCHFFPTERRAKESHPIVSKVKAWNRLNILRYTNKVTGETGIPLTVQERNLVDDLISGRINKKRQKQNKPAAAATTFIAIRELLFGDEYKNFVFKQENLDKDDKPLNKNFKGDLTEAAFTHNKQVREFWTNLDITTKADIIETLETKFDDEILETFTERYNMDEATATAFLTVKIPAGYADVSLKAYHILSTYVLRENDLVTYNQALKFSQQNNEMAFHNARRAKVFDKLPPYAEVLPEYVTPIKSGHEMQDRISNPVVHVGLNQLRVVMNEIIELMGGKPYAVNLELTTDLKRSAKQRQEIVSNQKKNQDANLLLDEELREHNKSVNSKNREKLRLFKEAQKANNGIAQCVYSGKTISFTQLFNGEVEVDHILPYAQTFDDHSSNKILAFRSFNNRKGNQSPYEAFHSTQHWDGIQIRIANLSKGKKAKFEADALNVYRERKTGFLKRQLTDTAYLSRAACKYLETLFSVEELKAGRLNVISGQATAQIREAWGLNTILNTDGENTKNRDDHRHHAVDAIVVAFTTPHLIATATRVYQTGALVDGQIFPTPYEHFHADASQSVLKVVTSHKQDHGVQGQLHKEKALKIINRKAVAEDGATPKQRTLKAVEGQKGVPEKDKIKEIVEPEVNGAIIFYNSDGTLGNVYTSGNNYCYEVYSTKKGDWSGELINSFTANSKEYQKHLKHKTKKKTCFTNGYPLIKRVRQKDVIYFDGTGKAGLEGYYLVRSFSVNGNIEISSINAVTASIKKFSPNSLKQQNPQFVHVTPAGQVIA